MATELNPEYVIYVIYHRGHTTPKTSPSQRDRSQAVSKELYITTRRGSHYYVHSSTILTPLRVHGRGLKITQDVPQRNLLYLRPIPPEVR